MNDYVEYYLNDGLLCRLNSSIVPPIKSYINIKSITYIVINVTYAIDYIHDPQKRMMRANVTLEKAESSIFFQN